MSDGYEKERNHSQLVERVSKLLRMAADVNASENERQQAQRHADAILASLQMTLGDVQALESDPMTTEQEVTVCRWELRLARILASWVGSVAVFVACFRGTKKVSGDVIWAGRASQVSIASSVYTSVRMHVQSHAILHYGGYKRGAGREWCEGFVYGLLKAIKTSQEERRANVVSTGIVLAAAKEADVFFRNQHKVNGMRQVPAPDVKNEAAFREGYAAGKTHSLDKKQRLSVAASRPQLES